MARAAPPGTLELLLHKATDPSNPEENWECIQRFSDQVNADADSTAAALKLLEHKIQSPQEAEALHALTVLEMCVNNCGENFHHEMGKFRFLNGLIKVLSPKYLGEWSTDRVKSRIVELLFSWMVWFPQEVKIRDAYQMLKKQGIVKQDPKLPEDKIMPPPSPRPASSIFDADDEKSKLLTRLLKSKNPEDLQAANRLIKGMIKEEQEKSAKVSRRLNALKEAHSSAEALEEMLSSCRESKGAGTPPPTLELLQATFAKCERLKPLLFRVASETVEDEEALGEVLQASDRLTRALCFYKDVVGTAGDSGTSSGAAAAGPQPLPDAANSLTLIDLSELGAGCQAPLQENAKTEPFLERLLSSTSTHSLDEELMLGLPISPTAAPPVSSQIPEMAPAPLPLCPASSSGSLAKLSIPLSSITLSTIPPVTVYEEKGLKAMLHFSRDPVPGQPATRVLVLSLLSTAPHPVQDIVFQAAVPKSMAIKLQPATGSELPAFNPLLPPTVISQVVLLANPHQAPLRLRYRLSFVQNGAPCIETGVVSDFPHAELWGGI
ncbi:ADP-ribosylation factor-binding protein GGA2 isoform X1 [Lacerta agilis]|uniref:ADP-ribosylation factor-binding protein GGA2 isoform X1 n=1 Tax=Lacerta agilis TaxID=80427 RepID=UPI001419E0E9|nr:ADP-ribosylation factor-binding protein GGA2 isoform X1 [Lacerta agilis]